jgi:FtsH-binding integral membrane protein
MNDFDEHVKILMFFGIGLLIAFLVAYSLNVERLWYALVVVLVVVVTVLATLAHIGRSQ